MIFVVFMIAFAVSLIVYLILNNNIFSTRPHITSTSAGEITSTSTQAPITVVASTTLAEVTSTPTTMPASTSTQAPITVVASTTLAEVTSTPTPMPASTTIAEVTSTPTTTPASTTIAEVTSTPTTTTVEVTLTPTTLVEVTTTPTTTTLAEVTTTPTTTTLAEVTTTPLAEVTTTSTTLAEVTTTSTTTTPTTTTSTTTTPTTTSTTTTPTTTSTTPTTTTTTPTTTSTTLAEVTTTSSQNITTTTGIITTTPILTSSALLTSTSTTSYSGPVILPVTITNDVVTPENLGINTVNINGFTNSINTIEYFESIVSLPNANQFYNKIAKTNPRTFLEVFLPGAFADTSVTSGANITNITQKYIQPSNVAGNTFDTLIQSPVLLNAYMMIDAMGGEYQAFSDATVIDIYYLMGIYEIALFQYYDINPTLFDSLFKDLFIKKFLRTDLNRTPGASFYTSTGTTKMVNNMSLFINNDYQTNDIITVFIKTEHNEAIPFDQAIPYVSEFPQTCFTENLCKKISGSYSGRKNYLIQLLGNRDNRIRISNLFKNLFILSMASILIMQQVDNNYNFVYKSLPAQLKTDMANIINELNATQFMNNINANGQQLTLISMHQILNPLS